MMARFEEHFMRTLPFAVILAWALLPVTDIPMPGFNGATARASEYTVAVSGVCPGRITLEWSGATPHRRQGIVFSRYQGQSVIPEGACKGTTLGISQPTLVRVIGTDGGSGALNVLTQLCAGYVQLVESGTCRTSNVARVP